nr:membrane protein [Candidatus Pantoea persica]
MKALPTLLLVAAALLSGCVSSGGGSSSDSTVSWYNPLSYQWSASLPWNWFGASLTATEQGVGSATAMRRRGDQRRTEGQLQTASGHVQR